MKLAKTALPLAVLSLIGIAVAILMFNRISPTEENADKTFAFGYLFLILIVRYPLIASIPLAIAILICELCLFIAPNKSATIKAAIVLMCILLPIMLFVAIYALIIFSTDYPLVTAIIALCILCYLASLVAAFVARAKIKREQNRVE